jgi:nuclear pore complex protein Nup54
MESAINIIKHRTPCTGAMALNFPFPQPSSGMSDGSPSQEPPATLSSHPFLYIENALNKSSPGYRFHAFLYNQMPPDERCQRMLFQRSPNERLWKQALLDNPDPAHLIPVLACGFEDLKARVDWQDDQVRMHRQKARELEGRIDALVDGLRSNSLASALLVRQSKLTGRILRIMKQLEGIRKTCSPLSPNESEMIRRLQELMSLDLASIPGITAQLQSLLGRIDLMSQLRDQKVADIAKIADSLEEHHTTIQSALKRLDEMEGDLNVINDSLDI